MIQGPREMSPDGPEKSKESYRESVVRLGNAQKKAAPGSPPYSIYVNRKIGRYIAAAAYQLGLTPNQVSIISSIFTMGGIIVLASCFPTWWIGVLVWLALAVGYAFDSADGQLARLRGGGSAAGEWLDHVLDSLKIATLHLAVLITMYRHFELTQSALLLVPIFFSIVSSVTFFAMILNDQLKSIHALRSGISLVGPAEGRRSIARTLALVPTDYGVLCLVFVLLGAHQLFFVVYALLFLANAGFLLLAVVKWFRDMQKLDRPIAS